MLGVCLMPHLEQRESEQNTGLHNHPRLPWRTPNTTSPVFGEVIKAQQVTEPWVMKSLLTFNFPIAFMLAVSERRHFQGNYAWVLQDVHLHS